MHILTEPLARDMSYHDRRSTSVVHGVRYDHEHDFDRENSVARNLEQARDFIQYQIGDSVLVGERADCYSRLKSIHCATVVSRPRKDWMVLSDGSRFWNSPFIAGRRPGKCDPRKFEYGSGCTYTRSPYREILGPNNNAYREIYRLPLQSNAPMDYGHSIQAYVDSGVKKRLQDAAADFGVNMADLIRLALEGYLDQIETAESITITKTVAVSRRKPVVPPFTAPDGKTYLVSVNGAGVPTGFTPAPNN